MIITGRVPGEQPCWSEAVDGILGTHRLGHASITVTLAVYGHVMPGDQKRAADRFAALIREA